MPQPFADTSLSPVLCQHYGDVIYVAACGQCWLAANNP